MFRNREAAAFRLAARLHGRAFHQPLVLAIPRGGVIVGAVLANDLGADLDVVLTRKLRLPGSPARAIGALAENGAVYLSRQGRLLAAQHSGYFERERQDQLLEITRYRQLFREGWPAAPIRRRSVIVADDGIVTGSTMLAALQALRGHYPLEVLVAVPIGAPPGLEQIRPWCDEIVCLLQPKELRSLSPCYEEFSEVHDDEVVDLLRTFAVGRHPTHERT
jgi:predicted phosphoribosyltransferase